MIPGSTKETGTLRNKGLVLQFDADPSFRFGSVFVYKNPHMIFVAKGPRASGFRGLGSGVSVITLEMG